MKTIILMLIKNEHRYIEEWIRYHCELGIDTLFIIEDEGSDPHNDICNKYDKVILRKKSSIPNIRIHKQAHILSHVYNNIIRQMNYDWCFLLDTDEFITCNSLSVLDKYKDKTGVHLKWHNFGANGHISKPNLPQFEAFTKPCGNRHIDEIFHKTGKMCYNTHLYDETCFLHWRTDAVDQDEIYIRHYITRSWEEWKWKLTVRGMCNPGNRKIEDFFIYNPDMKEYKEQLCKQL